MLHLVLVERGLAGIAPLGQLPTSLSTADVQLVEMATSSPASSRPLFAARPRPPVTSDAPWPLMVRMPVPATNGKRLSPRPPTSGPSLASARSPTHAAHPFHSTCLAVIPRVCTHIHTITAAPQLSSASHDGFLSHRGFQGHCHIRPPNPLSSSTRPDLSFPPSTSLPSSPPPLLLSSTLCHLFSSPPSHLLRASALLMRSTAQ